MSNDQDPLETHEWLAAFDSVRNVAGRERAAFLLEKLRAYAQEKGVDVRRLDLGAAEHGAELRPEVVDREEENVGPRSGSRRPLQSMRLIARVLARCATDPEERSISDGGGRRSVAPMGELA